MKKKTIYDLNLHEEITLENGTEILRVHGGWIYRFYTPDFILMPDGNWSENFRIDSTFVPYVPYSETKFRISEFSPILNNEDCHEKKHKKE